MGLPLERFPDWPAALDWEQALAYTGLAEVELKRRARGGEVTFLPKGPNGKIVARREELDALLLKIWSADAAASEDMDFGDD